MLVKMWYSILELFYSPFVLQLLHNASGGFQDVEFNSPGPVSTTTVSPKFAWRENPGNLTRLCPEFNATSSVRLLYYANPRNPQMKGCYELLSTSICGENMRFYSVDNEFKIGECACDESSHRMSVFHEETNKCYPIFQQGYCEPGMWLDFTREFTSICTKNPCYNSTVPDKDIVLFENECVEVGSGCHAGGIVGFELDKRLPQCVPRRLLIRAMGPPGVRCKSGTYRSRDGRCQPAFPIFD